MSDANAPRFCIGCRFANKLTGPSTHWLCGHFTADIMPPVDPVTGERPAHRRLPCGTARTTFLDGTCGPSGQFWEARP